MFLKVRIFLEICTIFFTFTKLIVANFMKITQLKRMNNVHGILTTI